MRTHRIVTAVVSCFVAVAVSLSAREPKPPAADSYSHGTTACLQGGDGPGIRSTWKTPTAKEKFPTRTWNCILGSYPSRFTRTSPLARTTGHSDARLRRTRANKLCPARSCLTILKRTPEERFPELMAIMNSDLTAAGPRAAASLWTVWPLAARSSWLLSPAGCGHTWSR